eukprot:TRINITY_DN2703_c0_g1_i2.p1 TRINITY_DN2703_c0_g1~~TRINITY_DN2703_c0_g1_i2.p1  ORF type:complete len:141 (+),score=39.91 TRINITY_DN2703_c0_g1_i2:406-828(+)
MCVGPVGRRKRRTLQDVPDDALLLIFGFTGVEEVLLFHGTIRAGDEVYWTKARHSIFGHDGDDLPWPFDSREEYFKMIVFQARDPLRFADFMRANGPWPLSNATYQPFNYLMLPPPTEKHITDEDKEQAERFITNFKYTL